MAIKMTRAEYEAKYGIQPTITPAQETQEPSKPLSNKIADFIGAKGITEQFGADIARLKAPKEQKSFVDYPKMKSVVGSAIQTGANLIPGVSGGKLATKIGSGIATGYAYDVGSKMQADAKPKDIITPGIGTAIGGALPVAGATINLASKVTGRLLKGLGSGLSGVSTKTIDAIVNNPNVAQKATEKLAKTGNSKMLEENARQIVQGVSSIRQNARKAFGQGLEQLSETDIKPELFRQNTQKFLDKYGSSIKNGRRILSNVEFEDPKNIAKASSLIDRLQTAKLDGKSLRKLSDDIDSAKFKTATSDERLAFNAFLKDLSTTLKESVSKSTNKLDEINKAFASDMELAEATQNIFGKVNFKNLPEVVKASQKLESLFSQKGLAPDVIDSFLKKIGISPEDFRTTEAVRQISDKATGANTKGLSLGEMAQQFTSSVVTPQMVRDVAVFSGLADSTTRKLLSVLSPAAKKALLNAAVQNQSSQVQPQK